MNLKSLSNNFLLQKMNELVKREREITLEILHHLREVERRSLFAELAYPSLFEYCVKELKYSAGSAHRRIQAMRLLKEMPELEEKIETGSLNLTAITQAQSFFKKEEIKSKEEKRELLLQLENKSKREVEKELVSRSSDAAKLIPEKLRQVTPSYSELKFLIGESELKELEELKDLLAHTFPGGTLKEIIIHCISYRLKAIKPKASKDITEKNIQKQKLLPPVEIKRPTRYIGADVRRKVWARDSGKCTFLNKVTGKTCDCRRALEFDHIKPYAVGGENTVENLRLRCRTHNQLAAVNYFGRAKISHFVPRMR